MLKSLKSMFKSSSSTSSTSSSSPPSSPAFSPPADIPDTPLTPAPHPVLAAHHGIPTRITAAAASPAASLLAVATHDGCVKVFGAEGAEAALLRPPAPTAVVALLFATPTLLLAAVNAELLVWDLAAHPAAAHDATHPAHAAAPAAHAYPLPDGAPLSTLAAPLGSPFVYCATLRGHVAVFHVVDRRYTLYTLPRTLFDPAAGAVTHMALSPVDESTAVVVTDAPGVFVVDLVAKSAALLPLSTPAATAGPVAWRRDGKRFAVALHAPDAAPVVAHFHLKSAAKSGPSDLCPVSDADGRIVDLVWAAPAKADDDVLAVLAANPSAAAPALTLLHAYSAHPDGSGTLTHGGVDSLAPASLHTLVPAWPRSTSPWPAQPRSLPPMFLVLGSGTPAAAALLCDVGGGAYLELPLPRSLGLNQAGTGAITATTAASAIPPNVAAALAASSPRGAASSASEWPFTGGTLAPPPSPPPPLSLLATGAADGTIALWDVSGGPLTEVTSLNLALACPCMPSPPAVVALALDATSGSLAAVCASGDVFVFCLEAAPASAAFVSFAYGPGAVCEPGVEAADDLAPDPGYVVRMVCTGTGATAIAFAPGGGTVVVGIDGGALVLDTTMRTLLATVPLPIASAGVTALSFVPFPHHSHNISRAPGAGWMATLSVAIGTSDGDVVVWCAESGKTDTVLACGTAGNGAVTGIHFVDGGGAPVDTAAVAPGELSAELGDPYLVVVCEHHIRVYATAALAEAAPAFVRPAKPTTALVASRVVVARDTGTPALVAVSGEATLYVLSMVGLGLLAKVPLLAVASRPVSSQAVGSASISANGLVRLVLDSRELVVVDALAAPGAVPEPQATFAAVELPPEPKRPSGGFFKSLIGGSGGSDAAAAAQLEALLGEEAVAARDAGDGGAGPSAAIGASADDVRETMAENQQKLAERGERLESMEERTAAMVANAQAMESSLAEYNREQAAKKWWQL